MTRHLKTYKITEEDGKVRIDKYLADKNPHYSRSAIQRLFQLNLVKTSKDSIKPGDKTYPNMTITVDMEPIEQVPDVIDLPIIYEDQDVVVIDKPSGVISHATGKYWQEASVASFIRSKLSETEDFRAGIVHRLDRATSGVIICAKNQKALSFLQKQFSNRSVRKTYIAAVSLPPKHPKAVIDAPIARDNNDPRRFKVDPNGKNAITNYEIYQTTKNFCLLKLTPMTGRTHQLRVHLNYIGRPIIGDDYYGGSPYKRLLLHAHELEIKLPSGQIKKFTSNIPDEFYD